uniref:Cyclase-like protein 2 n=1 Tax=Oryza barthii TaxID=65489 RepID=A0A0D3GJ26_9ORYZ
MAHLATVVLLLVAAARQAPLAAGDHSANPRLPTCASAPDVAAPQEHGDGGGVGGGGRRILDITHAVRAELPVLGSCDGVGALVRLKKSMANGSRSNLSELRMSVHTGTHVDAPGHMWQPHFDAGLDVDTLDLGLLNGPALLVDVPRHSNITAEVMESLNIPRGVRRVLFRTMNTDKRLMWQKESDLSFVGFTEDGAQWLVGYTDIKLVGVDYLSVASYEHMIPAHVVFLKSKEIVIVEALKLDDVEPGMYMLHCLPLRLAGAEGSPVRSAFLQGQVLSLQVFLSCFSDMCSQLHKEMKTMQNRMVPRRTDMAKGSVKERHYSV